MGCGNRMTWSGELLQLAAESVTRHWERSRQLVGAAGERYLLALLPQRPLENCCTHEVNSNNLFILLPFSLTPSQKSSPFDSLSPLSTAVVLLQKDLPMSAPDHSPREFLSPLARSWRRSRSPSCASSPPSLPGTRSSTLCPGWPWLLPTS